MRKKDLIQKLNELIDSHNTLQHQLELAKRENEELKVLLGVLSEELDAERKSNKELKDLVCDAEKACEEPEIPAPATETEAPASTGFTVNLSEEQFEDTADAPEVASVQPVDDVSPAEETSVYETEEETKVIIPPVISAVSEPAITVELPPLVNEITEYGSVAIGKIVCESVKYSGKITASQSENRKELLNLIMGKGEVAKNEIFSITESEVSPETKRELIDAQLEEALDYFKSVAEQI
ncbi:MAG: hypothetical protein IIV97_01455 [Oscillospiraceae bacterium]|nr:hypothetical protein [Oscillospiraceae bacterium]